MWWGLGIGLAVIAVAIGYIVWQKLRGLRGID